MGNAVNNDASAMTRSSLLRDVLMEKQTQGVLKFADRAPLHTTTVRTIRGTIDPGSAHTASGKAKMFITYAHTTNVARTSQMTKKINVYSFALKPEEHQPCGTCNFSRIDTAKLITSGSPAMVKRPYIYTVNYNVLRIMSEIGLAYSTNLFYFSLCKNFSFYKYFLFK